MRITVVGWVLWIGVTRGGVALWTWSAYSPAHLRGYTCECSLTGGGNSGTNYDGSRFLAANPRVLLPPSASRSINQSPGCRFADYLEVTADSVLRYGMLEAEAVVHGGTVVYDPQSPFRPQRFTDNGSTAERLAIVANRQEAAQMAGTSNLNEAGMRLREQADVVVIKDGSDGAMVFENASSCQVPVFRTRPTFSIGSGDIFSAVFAFEWMVNSVRPDEAAHLASLATAWYCQFQTVPLPHPLGDGFHLGPRVPDHIGRKRLVYLASPFFNLMQIWCMNEVRDCLRKFRLKVFSPRHDVGTKGGANIIATADLQGLRDCDLMFAILDGHDPGTIFEIGYARALGKPVIILLGNPDSTHLTMFEGTGCQIFGDLASAVYAAAWTEV